MQQNKIRVTNMAESAPMTIQQVFEARPKWRSASTAPLTGDILRMIDEIRMEVKSGATADGWHMANSGKGAPTTGRTSGFQKHGGSGLRNTTNTVSKGHSGGGAGGWSHSQRQNTPGRNYNDKQHGSFHHTASRPPVGGGAGTWSTPREAPTHSESQTTRTNAWTSEAPSATKRMTFYNSAIPVDTTPAKVSAAPPVEVLPKHEPAIMPAPVATAPVSPVKKTNRSRFTNSDIVKDNSPRETMLLQIQFAINKLTEDNYDHLKRLLVNFLKLGQNEYLTRCMGIIFNSALTEPKHGALFAKLLFEMSQEFVFLQSEINLKYEEFISTIFKNIEPAYDTDTLDESNKKLINKDKRKNYSKFITELLKFNVIEDTYFLEIIKQIIDTIHDQSTNSKFKNSIHECGICLKTIVNVLCVTNDVESYKRIRTTIKEIHYATLKEMSAGPAFGQGFTKSAGFTLLDICDQLDVV